MTAAAQASGVSTSAEPAPKERGAQGLRRPPGPPARSSDYLELCKPRIAALAAATAGFGYFLAGGRWGTELVWLLLGTAFSAASSGCLNQLLEREDDARMLRTRRRPLPTGRVRPAEALAFGLALGVGGALALAWKAGLLAAFLAVLTSAIYLLGYTPLKKRTPQSTWVGSFAGAMPPLIGWAAAAGSLALGAWLLFAIQFLWQIPHFLALFWIHREDYARAGFRVMPVVDPTGRLTACQIAIHSLALLPASLSPTLLGSAGVGYGLPALVLAAAYLVLGLRASWTMSVPDTRRLFLASLAYLPALFGLLAFAG